MCIRDRSRGDREDESGLAVHTLRQEIKSLILSDREDSNQFLIKFLIPSFVERSVKSRHLPEIVKVKIRLIRHEDDVFFRARIIEDDLPAIEHGADVYKRQGSDCPNRC